MVDPGTRDKSRQKSCDACVRSKRRCDKQTPRCTRCAKRGLPCLYRKFLPASGSDDSTTHAMDVDIEDFSIAPDQSSIVLGTELECNGFPTYVPLIHEPLASGTSSGDNFQMLPVDLFDPLLVDFSNLTNYSTETAQTSEPQLWDILPVQDQTSMTSVSRNSNSPLHPYHRFSAEESPDASVS